MPVAVIGMHRSGTSMVARLLNMAGVSLGDYDAMLPATEFNEAGHWENKIFLDINERILQRFAGRWDDPPAFPSHWYDLPDLEPLMEEARAFVSKTFGDTELWGWKDPRTTLTLPFWQRIVPDLRHVICVRNPLDVAASLLNRDAMSSRQAIALWQMYTETGLADTSVDDRLVVFYEDFFSDFDAALKPLQEFLHLPEMESGSEREVDLMNFPVARLNHHRHSVDDVIGSPEVPISSRLLYDALRRRPHTIDTLFATRTFDVPGGHPRTISERESVQRWQAFNALTDHVTAQEETIRSLTFQLSQRQQDTDWLQAKLIERDEINDHLTEQALTLERALDAERLQGDQSRHRLEAGEQQIEALTSHSRMTEEAMQEIGARVAEWQEHWDRVESTIAWRFVLRLRSTRRVFAPENSWRERAWFRVFGRKPSFARTVASPLTAPLRPVGTTIEAQTATLHTTPETLETRGTQRLRDFLASNDTMEFPAIESPRVSIVIPAWNKAEYTFLTLETLRADTTSVPFEVIVVDNGSSDDTQAFFRRLINVQTVRNETNLGFGEACNQGAALGQGEFICLLNSDVQPRSGWLAELVRVADTYPKCGAVGAKLVLPDGRLQEAGSIIWRDGSALGYGRNADPEAPQYNFMREVDFCSAACLLVRKRAFDDLGGFDSRYSPAYYEDADLCLALRQEGYAVLYAPHSVVLHIEHASSNRGSAEALQLRNRDRFREKWQDELSGHYPPRSRNELMARDRREGRRVLVIDDRIPESRFGSGFPRTRAMLELLTEAGYVVSYLPTADPTPVEPATQELQQLGIEVLHSVVDLPSALRQRANFFDLIVVSRPTNARFVPTVAEHNSSAVVAYDAEAVFSLREALKAELKGAPLTPDEVEKSIRSELASVSSADMILTVTGQERDTIQSYYPDAAIHVWGHPTRVYTDVPGFQHRADLLFVGYLASGPNDDALLQLLDIILPQVRTELDCGLRVVGAGASAAARISGARPLSRAIFDGYVEDLTSVYDASRIFVAPHRFAAGVPLKVIEAMAHGVPCVVSEVLARQLGITDGEHALIASSAEEWSSKICMLYNDEPSWLRIQQNAIALVRSRYDRNAMRSELTSWLESAYAHKHPAVTVK